MDKYSGQKSAAHYLYPPIDPFESRRIDTGDGHSIYVEQCGNPDGIPVIVLHGGPGGGCSPTMRRYFNPLKYHIILFDQRGCGRSEPRASVENNTTWHLVRDIDMIRDTLGIKSTVLFGGSWGATLALIYAQYAPNAVSHLVLRGMFTATQAELDWFYGGGAGKFWPETWRRFVEDIPVEERSDLITAYHKRLFTSDLRVQTKFAQNWAEWENALATFETTGHGGISPPEYARAFARLENHYFINRAFLEVDGQIYRDMSKIAHIPGVIVQGRYDMICPPNSAYEIARLWPDCDLRMVHHAGHAMSEPGITNELIRATDRIASGEFT